MSTLTRMTPSDLFLDIDTNIEENNHNNNDCYDCDENDRNYGNNIFEDINTDIDFDDIKNEKTSFVLSEDTKKMVKGAFETSLVVNSVLERRRMDRI